MSHRSTCERARLWASLQVDGALSEVEQRLLDAHLVRCPACRSFARVVSSATEELRAAPLEEWHAGVRTVALRRRRGLPRLSTVTAVAGVAAAVTALAVVPLQVSSDRPAPVDRPVIVVDATSVEDPVEQRKFLADWRDHENAQHALESDLATVRGFGAGGG